MPFKTVVSQINAELDKLLPYRSDYFSTLDDYTNQEITGVPVPSSIFQSPSTTYLYLERNSRPSGLGYEFLARVASKDPLIASIINTRINQVILFARPRMLLNKEEHLSYSIFPIEADTIKEPEKKIIKKLELMLYNTGFYPRPRDIFSTFLKKIIRDRFRYDQVNFEILHDDKGRPVEFYATDASTIRLNNEFLPETHTFNYEKYTFQLLNSEIDTYFRYQDMAWGVFFPKTDVEDYGYGMPEIEQVFTLLSAKIYAEEFNKKFFIQGMGKGFLFAKKNLFNRAKMLALQEELRNTAIGYMNAHKIPIISAPEIDDIKYIQLDRAQKDIEFSRYLEYLINLICGVFQIDPSEVNFQSRSSLGGVVQTESTYQTRIKFSKDKGLKPLLNYIEDLINQYIIFPLTDMKFMFKFVGLEEMTEKERIEKIRTEVTNWKTLNEVRKELGLPEIEGGDIVLSPTYIQGKMVGGAPAGGMEGMGEAMGGESPEGNAPEEEGLSEEEKNDYIKRFTEQLEKETSEGEETGSEINTEDIWKV